MKKFLTFCILILVASAAFAQSDVRPVRSGNRKFRSGNFRQAELDYRRALVKDSTSLAATYDLASSLYRQNDFEGAGKTLSKLGDDAVSASEHSAKVHFNKGDVALQKKDYASAVKEFRAALLETPEDMDAKENYIYAKLMLRNQQDNQQDNRQDNQQDDQDDQNPQPQPQDPPQQDKPQEDPQSAQQPQEEKMSPRQAQQILKAIQAKEKETQDKVEKEKAEALKSRQKEKNW